VGNAEYYVALKLYYVASVRISSIRHKKYSISRQFAD